MKEQIINTRIKFEDLDPTADILIIEEGGAISIPEEGTIKPGEFDTTPEED